MTLTKPAEKASKSIFQAIVKNPQLRDLNMWMVWMIPTVLVPTLRFAEDSKRPYKDRFRLSMRDFMAYMGGVALNFTLAPVAYVLLENKFGPGRKAKLLSTAVGATVAAAYSGLMANKFAGWINRRVFGKGADLPAGHAIGSAQGSSDTSISANPGLNVVSLAANNPVQPLQPATVAISPTVPRGKGSPPKPLNTHGYSQMSLMDLRAPSPAFTAF
jgi:hypothetical protein